MRLASRFGYANQIRRDRPLTHEELIRHVPSIFGEDRHTSLLEKPSGEVSGLITAAQTAAEAEQQAAETSAALPDEADYPSE